MRFFASTAFIAVAMVFAAASLAESGHQHNSVCGPLAAPTKAAERKLGGALYHSPAVHRGHAASGHKHMEGPHMRHDPQHGGGFFMAPNKLHHLETVYSDACGLRIQFYNAYTEAIGAGRFQAFLIAQPDDEDEAEVVRILTLYKDGSMLHTPLDPHLSNPFTIRLHVKFPGELEPQIFTMNIGSKKHE